jgi:hypothetical protein
MGVGSRFLVVSSIALAAILAATSAPAYAQDSSAGNRETQSTALTTSDSALHASLERLFARSATWRGAIELVRKTGRRAYVVTPSQVRMIDPHDGRTRAFDRNELAETLPVHDGEHRVEVVVVVVNVRLLQEMHWAHGPLVDFERDLDRILAHEIYAHAIPYLLAGHLSGRCADPRPGEPAAESCAIKRENEIRTELGLGIRTDSGLDSLSLVRNGRRQMTSGHSLIDDVAEHLPRSVFFDHRPADVYGTPRP